MEGKLGQPLTILFKYENLILSERRNHIRRRMWRFPCGLFLPCVSPSK